MPAVATAGKGLGFFMLGQHIDRLNFNVVYDELTGPVTATHVRGKDKVTIKIGLISLAHNLQKLTGRKKQARTTLTAA